MSSIRYIYLRNEKKHPVACVAVSYDKEAKTVAYALSILNPKDTFNRSLGRKIAVDRLGMKPRILELQVPKHEITAHYITHSILKDLLMWPRKEVPVRTRNAAQRWIDNALSSKKEKATKLEDDYLTL